jgi:hypothetical protein
MKMAYSNIKAFSWISISLALGIGAFFLSALVSNKTHAAATPEAVSVPLTAQFTKNMYWANGNLGRTESKLYAQFSNGAVMFRKRELYPGNRPVFSEILDPNTGDRMFLDEVTKSVSTVRKSPQEMRATISDIESQGCPEGVDLRKLVDGPQLLGRRTVVYLQKPIAGITDEIWMAPDLNCLVLQEVQRDATNGSYNRETATWLKLGEPGEELRGVPADYLERDPEAVEELHKLMSGGDMFWGPLALRHMKKEYSAKR